MSTVILWLDSSANSTTSFRDKLLQYRSVQIFTEPKDCINYIQTHLAQTLYLVASGSLAEHVVPQINECANIKQIFVFCASMALHTHWAANYIDKLLMFDHQDDLLGRLWIEMEKYFREQAQEYNQQAEESKQRAKEYKQPPCG